MPCVVLICKDWSTRALLRAELLEEGVDVVAVEDTGEAVMAVELAGSPPPLIIADLSSSDQPEADADWLAELPRAVPVWIIAGKTEMVSKDLEKRGFEKILFKPLDAGELVEQIKRRLKKK